MRVRERGIMLDLDYDESIISLMKMMESILLIK